MSDPVYIDREVAIIDQAVTGLPYRGPRYSVCVYGWPSTVRRVPRVTPCPLQRR